MKRFEILAVAIAIAITLNAVSAEYWFQTGARAGNSAAYNNGASVEIQTITPQHPFSGSYGFWIGEDLQNGAFLQVGYVVENQSGDYTSSCTTSGCTGDEYINAGDAEWFYEYFPSRSNISFLGGIGPDGSAGANGTFNTYSFYSIGDTWYFMFNGNVIGSANLGTSTSGPNVPTAIVEAANASNANDFIIPVAFSNLSAYINGRYDPVAKGYATIGYGYGSKETLQNPYGVKEIGNRVNYFEAGSGLPQPQTGTELWSLGYRLRIVSDYANISGSVPYAAYSAVGISAPEYVNISKGVRAVFQGWIGSGLGSYTGIMNNVTLQLDSNITETAEWQLQYFVNISSAYNTASGSGWYNNGSVAYYSIDNGTVYYNATAREVFTGWSNGNDKLSGKLIVNAPEQIAAIWQKEFLVNATSSLPSIGATGSGWYPNGTITNLYVDGTTLNLSSSERYAFVGWSNGVRNASFQIAVDKPVQVEALFDMQYLVTLQGVDEYGNPVQAESFYIDGKDYGTSAFLTANATYNVTGALYNGAMVRASQAISVDGPSVVQVKLPLYNVSVKVTDFLGIPVNSLIVAKFSNMTTSDFYTGGRTITLKDVPYGYVNATVYNLGIGYHASTRSGIGLQETVFSLYDIAIAIIVLAAIFSSYEISKRHYSKGAAPQQGNK
ncbi:MAG: hypothetical protein ACP5K9_03450 [Candidatus Micrarchaeia archaeon]